MNKAMRITGGLARGILLRCPQGQGTRPATDFLRQALFSSLGKLIENALFLDLFAGTGSYGLESLSRGAKGGIFVEKNREAVACLQENLAAVAKSARINPIPCQIRALDVDQIVLSPDQKFSIIFVDPPYTLARQKGAEILQHAAQFLAPNSEARLTFELPSDYEMQVPPSLALLRVLGKSGGRNNPCVHIYGAR